MAIKPSTAQAQAEFAAISAALSGERPIAYSVNLARLTGDVKAALFLSQLIYWTRVGVHVEQHGGWIYKTREQWSAETGLSRYEQESVRAKLMTQGLIQEARVGTPARNCYRVVPQVISTSLARLLRSEPVQWTLFDIRSNAHQFKALIGRQLAFYRIFAEITPSVTAAVFLTKALAVQRNVTSVQAERDAKSTSHSTKSGSDWFHLSPTQWHEETGLTTAQQRDGKQKLCQLSLLELAVQTYPKKRTYLRVSLSKVSSLLKDHLFSKIADGKPANGILGVLLRGIKQKDERGAKSAMFADFAPGADVRKLQTSAPGAELCKLQTSAPGAELCKLRTSAPSSLFSTQCQNPPSRNTDSAFLDGGFSHTSRRVLTHQMGGNHTIHRRVLTALHARASVLTTDITTTTTTSPRLSPLPADGGKSHQVVVVVPKVVENKIEEKREVHAQAPFNADPSAPGAVPVHQLGLVWPKELSPKECEISLHLMVSSKVQIERHQVLIDELAGNLAQPGKVKNSLSYFSVLVRREVSTPGGIVPLAGFQVQALRDAQAATDKRIAATVAQSLAKTAALSSHSSASSPSSHSASSAQATSQHAASGVKVELSPAALAAKVALADLRRSFPRRVQPSSFHQQINAAK